jgi:hypothetical protein
VSSPYADLVVPDGDGGTLRVTWAGSFARAAGLYNACRASKQRLLDDRVRLGAMLAAIRGQLEHRGRASVWGQWLRESNLHLKTARRCMALAEVLAENGCVSKARTIAAAEAFARQARADGRATLAERVLRHAREGRLSVHEAETLSRARTDEGRRAKTAGNADRVGPHSEQEPNGGADEQEGRLVGVRNADRVGPHLRGFVGAQAEVRHPLRLEDSPPPPVGTGGGAKAAEARVGTECRPTQGAGQAGPVQMSLVPAFRAAESRAAAVRVAAERLMDAVGAIDEGLTRSVLMDHVRALVARVRELEEGLSANVHGGSSLGVP